MKVGKWLEITEYCYSDREVDEHDEFNAWRISPLHVSMILRKLSIESDSKTLSKPVN